MSARRVRCRHEEAKAAAAGITILLLSCEGAYLTAPSGSTLTLVANPHESSRPTEASPSCTAVVTEPAGHRRPRRDGRALDDQPRPRRSARRGPSAGSPATAWSRTAVPVPRPVTAHPAPTPCRRPRRPASTTTTITTTTATTPPLTTAVRDQRARDRAASALLPAGAQNSDSVTRHHRQCAGPDRSAPRRSPRGSPSRTPPT